jgi:hypothetical protein
MAFVGHGNYVVVVPRLGGSKASSNKLVSQREPRFGKTWFPAGLILPSEELIDAAVRELFKDIIGLTTTVDDLTMSSSNHVRVLLHEGKRKIVNVFSAYVVVPYVTSNLRAPTKVQQDDTSRPLIMMILTRIN